MGFPLTTANLTGDVTIDCNVNLTSAGTGTGSRAWNIGTSYPTLALAFPSGSTTPNLYYNDASVLASSGGAIGTGNSVNIRISIVNKQASLFVAGAFCGTVTLANTPNGVGGVAVGSNFGSNGITGKVSGFRVTSGLGRSTAAFTPATGSPYPTALPLSYDPLWKEVTCFCPLSSSTDLSGNGLTISGLTITGSPSLFGQSVASFNGTSGTQAVITTAHGAFALPGDFTLEFFCRPTAAGGTAEGWVSSVTTGGLAVLQTASAYTLSIQNYGVSALFTTTSGLVQSAWNHVAIVRVGSTLMAFINGAYAGSATSTSPFVDGNWNLGGLNSAGTYPTGNLAQLRVTNGRARYTANFTPPSAAFLTTGVP